MGFTPGQKESAGRKGTQLAKNEWRTNEGFVETHVPSLWLIQFLLASHPILDEKFAQNIITLCLARALLEEILRLLQQATHLLSRKLPTLKRPAGQ